MEPLGIRLARALMNAQSGGFLATPPALDGSTGLGLAGMSGVPRPRRWETVVSAVAPELPGEEVHFVTLDDGSIVVDEDVPDGCLTPLAEAVESMVHPPYRAEGARLEGDVWGIGAIRVAIARLPAGFEGDWIELTSYHGERHCLVDGKEAPVVDDLIAVGEHHGPDFAVRAERIDDTTWAAECEPL